MGRARPIKGPEVGDGLLQSAVFQLPPQGPLEEWGGEGAQLGMGLYLLPRQLHSTCLINWAFISAEGSPAANNESEAESLGD